MFDEPDAYRLAGEPTARDADGPPHPDRTAIKDCDLDADPDRWRGGVAGAGGDGDIDWDAYYAEVFRRTKPAPPPLRPIRRRAANGSILVAIALGLREVFDPEKPEEAVVAEVPGDPDRPDKPFHLELDPDDPKATRAIVRLWAKPYGV